MYAGTDDLKNRLGTAVYQEIYPNDAHALEDLTDAQAEIDGAVGLRYQLPVTAPEAAALLKSWTLTLGEERAYSRAAGSRYAEKVRLRVEQVRKRLEEIRRDEFRLPGAQESGGAPVSFLSMESPVFSRESLKRF